LLRRCHLRPKRRRRARGEGTNEVKSWTAHSPTHSTHPPANLFFFLLQIHPTTSSRAYHHRVSSHGRPLSPPVKRNHHHPHNHHPNKRWPTQRLCLRRRCLGTPASAPA
jgi:hypothetical protein